MSEEVQDEAAPEPASHEAPAEKQPTAGELLRQAREAAGLHVAALAVSMKVPVKKLEALEADRLDLLPDAVFVRALASSVCRTLKIDPAPVLALLPQTAAPQLKPDEWGINAPFRAPGDVATASMWSQLSRPGVLAALVLLAAALVLIFFPSMEQKDGTGGTASEVVVALPTPAPVAAQPETSIKPTEAQVEKPVEVKNPLPQPVAVAPAPVAAPVALQPAQVAPQPAPAAPAAAVAAVTQPTPTSGSGVVAFKARGPSWVEVTDAQGVVQLRRTLASGETVGVSGALPLSVVVGRADVTDVLVRGKPFSLEAVARENVARFEVK
jgi:cytoskeleton protein RodZ